MRHGSVWTRLRDWHGRSGWTEWALFVIAALVAAGLLIVLALSSPIFQGPAPLPESDPSPATHASADADPPEGPADATPPSDPPP